MLRSFFTLNRLILLGAALLCALCTVSQVFAQAKTSYAFTVLGPDGAMARVITPDAACPQITIDGKATAMQVRAAPDSDFPVTVCDAAIPLTAKSASVSGQTLHLPKSKPNHVVTLGDTGCRLKGSTVQSCNVPAQWPFAQVAASAAATKPDLVIHVGDYHYRETACDTTKADCAGSPFGDNWAAWEADLFAPGRPLLEAAPWVFVVGNHEDCSRAGVGFFRLLDPRPMFTTCPVYTDPYALNYMDPQLVVMDDSAIDDFNIKPDQVAAFTKQFQQINDMAKGNSWLLVHDPLYVFGHLGDKDGKEQLFIDQLTLQQASNNTFPPSIQIFIAGHIHLFETLSFDQSAGQRPPQLVVGNGGTLLDKPISTPLTGLDMAGMKVAAGSALDKFGFSTMSRNGNAWAIGVKDASGGTMDRCALANRTLLCGQAALPSSGGDFASQNQLWLGLGALGIVLLLIGLAIGLRSMNRTAR